MIADWKPESWVAIYAAIIGTSAFLLNLKSWFDSGVKLSLSLIPDGMVITPGSGVDEKNVIILTVTNRGDAPTMVTNMVLLEMTSWWQRWRIRPKASYVVTNPQHLGYPANVPSDLEPAKKWTGLIRTRVDVIPNLRTGNFYAGIYASHRNRPYLMQIPKKIDKLPEGATELRQ